jgi:hypothetical protein
MSSYGLPVFVAEAIEAGEQPGSLRVSALDPERPDWLADWLHRALPRPSQRSPCTSGTDCNPAGLVTG